MFQLRGDSISTSSLDQEISGFLSRYRAPTSAQVIDFLKLYSADQREQVAQALVAKGVDTVAVANATRWIDSAGLFSTHKSTIYGVLTLASAAASGFHGYRRNQSIGWGLAWFVLGGIFPVVTPVIALAQGFGKPK